MLKKSSPLKHKKGDFPITDAHCKKIITFPCDQHLEKRKIDFNLKESLEKLSLLKETEKEIISLVNGYPEILEQCYKNTALHPLCFYLRDLSSKFHSFYNAEKIISDDKEYSDAKIALSIAIKEIINNGLNILGIGCPEKM